jgi:hypothetical protein
MFSTRKDESVLCVIVVSGVKLLHSLLCPPQIPTQSQIRCLQLGVVHYVTICSLHRSINLLKTCVYIRECT